MGVLSKQAALAGVASLAVMALDVAQAHAQVASQAQLETLQGKLEAQAARLDAQEQDLLRQRAELADQLKMLKALQAADPVLAAAAGRGEAPAQTQAASQARAAPIQVAETAPSQPVGEAPPVTEERQAQIAALPDNSGVLTRPGHFVLEPSLGYSRASSNRLVFRGVEIVTGVQIGVIEANDAARDTLVGNLTGRLGLTRRAEVEMRVPYLDRHDRITTLAQRDEQVSRTSVLDGRSIGDVEFTGRYQLTRAAPNVPIVVANLRVKTNTGTSPFEVARDEFGVASELSTGSGTWGVEPSLSYLIVTDPAVIFGSIGYMHNFSTDVNKTLGGVLIGKVKPGDSISAALGFGFSLNQAFSFSLGYRHSYIFPSWSMLGGTQQRSTAAQVGALTFGMSYRVTEKRLISTAFEFGVTNDAPDVSITFRTPFNF